jgi:hypothetical protein
MRNRQAAYIVGIPIFFYADPAQLVHCAGQQAPPLTQPGPGRTCSDYKVSRLPPNHLGAIQMEKTILKI